MPRPKRTNLFVPTIATGEPSDDGGDTGDNRDDVGGNTNDADGNVTEESIGGVRVVEPESAGTGNAASGEPGKRRRGRPPGSGNAARSAAKATPKNLTETIAGALYGLHSFAAGMLDAKELELDQKEAAQLAEGIKGVTDQYTTSIDPKMVAWGNLFMILGLIYGPRFYAWKLRVKSEAPRRPAQVVNIRPDAPATAPKPNGAAAAQPQQPLSQSQMFGGLGGVQDE